MIRTYLMVGVVAVVAIFVGFMITAMFDAVDPLRTDIALALTPIQRASLDAFNMMIVDDPPTGAARGMQLALFGVLIGGLPAALISVALAVATRRAEAYWHPGWGAIFQAALVFQLSSLIVSVLLFLLVTVATPLTDLRGVFSVAGVLGLALLVHAICAAFGVRSWRALQAATSPEAPPRITS